MAKLIGSLPQQVPTNADLGTMAYLDADQMIPYLKGGRRNLIINGDFRVRQRGSTQPDRWFSMSGMNVDGSVTSHLKFTTTSTDPYQWYKVEDVGMSLAGKTVTWSFWAKSSDGENPVQYFAYTGSPTSGTLYPTPTGETDSAGFSRFEFQITLDSTTYTDRHEFRFEYRAVSGITIEMKEVQLELGSVATPFEHRSYGEELALCQRYYEVVQANSSFVMNISSSHAGRQRIPLKVLKRASPSLSFGFSSVTNFQYFGNACTGVSGAGSVSHIEVTYTGFNGWSPAVGGCVYVSSTNTGNKDIYVDAEL